MFIGFPGALDDNERALLSALQNLEGMPPKAEGDFRFEAYNE